MNYNVRVNARVNEEQERILEAIRHKSGAGTLSEAVRYAIAKAGEALDLAPGKAERREEVVNV